MKIYCNYCNTPTHADTSCPYQLKEKTMTTPEDTELNNHIFSIIGQASMCWSKTPTGVYDDTRAVELGRELMNLITLHTQKHELAAEKRGVAWTIGIIDEMHEIDSPIRDSHYKGIKSAIRETYQKDTGNGDPAPNYPIKVHLTNPAEGSEA